MVLDNGRFHKAKKLSVPRNVELTFLPPYSPELNPVERLWRDLKDQVAFDFYRSLAWLRQDVRTALATYTDETVASLTGYEYLLDAASALSSKQLV
ncbi:transposase [Salinibacter ruber]|uniref:transposase n=1 Tax=Salinibacter ruber TaxID=146919 RepID=UPI0013C3657C